jgi:drug/metabolite transporter (DMT)-like permease
VVASIIGFFLVNYNLKHLPAYISSIFANVATITSIIAGVILFRRKKEASIHLKQLVKA